MTAALELNSVVKRYGEKEAIRGLSLRVEQGETLGLLGPNGAGKTTLLKMTAGLCQPTEGAVRIFGANMQACRKAVSGQIGYVPQDSNLEREFTVREALVSYAKLFGVADYENRVKSLAPRMPWLQQRVETLSGGMARLALIARALLADPPLLLLDEPSVGLDPDMRQEIWNVIHTLKTQGKTVILTTHYMEEAETLCDRIALMKCGQLIQLGTPEELKKAACGAKAQTVTLEKAFLRLIEESGAGV